MNCEHDWKETVLWCSKCGSIQKDGAVSRPENQAAPAPAEPKGIYTVVFYKGDYGHRQDQANADNAICYIEHHFNAAESPTANYTCCVVGSNSSDLSKRWGDYYTDRCAETFKIKEINATGLLVGGYKGRGNYNLIHTNMPAILVEPLFCSNPAEAAIIKSVDGRRKLAGILVDSIRTFFPRGGIVAFSVGHKYKTSKPSDRGAPVYGGGWEAEFAEQVLQLAAVMLESGT